MLKYRFKQDNGSEYPDWERFPFNELYKSIPNKKFQIQSTEYLKNGNYIVIDQGQNYIAGFSNNKDKLFTDVPCIIYGDHTTFVKYSDKPFIVGADGTKLLKSNIFPKFAYYLLNANNVMPTGYHRHFSALKEKIFYSATTLEEQQKIADFLSAVDNQIDIQRQRVEVMETQKKGLLDKVFSQELRFKQDDGSNYPDWEEKQLKDVSDCSTARKTDKLSSYVSTDNMIANFGGVIFDNDDESTIRSVEYRNNDILLSNIRPYFKKLWLSDRNGVCSSDVKVFRPNNVNPAFLYYALSLDKFFSYIMKNVTGTKMPRGNVDFMKKYKFMVSKSLEEQQKIADFFTAIDNQIDIEKQRLDTMETIKKGLLQQMFC